MDVQKARYLIALAEHGSFSRAADAVGLTQPAFSRSIQSFEHELGMRLVDRRGRRIQLTPAGELAAERGRRVLKELSEAHRALARLVQGETGRISLGVAPMPSARLLTRFLREMTVSRPGVQVSVEFRTTSELLEMLHAQRIDVLVGDERSVPPSDDVLVERVAPWRARFLVRAGHPILQEPSPGVERLVAWPIASPGMSPEGARSVLDLLGPASDPSRLVSIRTNDLAVLAELAQQSDTIIVANPDALASQLASGELVALDVPGTDALGGVTVLARLSWRTPPSAAEVLYRIAREELP
ncbi:MAG TPA: LysR family transcriptional regulator [Gemmatimonadales bacterium]|nr:LysR family transcriptional regulator [Gemmatimonadales bacterium]